MVAGTDVIVTELQMQQLKGQNECFSGKCATKAVVEQSVEIRPMLSSHAYWPSKQ